MCQVSARASFLFAAILLFALSSTTVEAHGRSLQAQQALQLPKNFKIPNIFNTCKFSGFVSSVSPLISIELYDLTLTQTVDAMPCVACRLCMFMCLLLLQHECCFQASFQANLW